MAQLPILQYPHPALRSTSAPVQHFDQELWSLLDNLKDTLYATPGIGLCAPQVGELKQVVVMDLSDDNSALEEYINPEIITHSGLAIATEACLSLPGLKAKVRRAGTIVVKACDRHGDAFERTLENMHAICLQHELDHLEGKLFIDRISALRRLPMRGRLAAMNQTQLPATA
jgi:peptide deformylase